MTTNVTVTNLKGGVGKTTTSGLLAMFTLEHQSGSVVMNDIDPQFRFTWLFLGKDSQNVTIRDVLDQPSDLKKLISIVRPRLPYSKSFIRRAWILLPFPDRLNSVFDSIFDRIFGKSALPIPVVVENVEVLNG